MRTSKVSNCIKVTARVRGRRREEEREAERAEGDLPWWITLKIWSHGMNETLPYACLYFEIYRNGHLLKNADFK